MKKTAIAFVFHFLFLLLLVTAQEQMKECPCDLLPKPSLWHKEETARWMVHSLDWGVLSTISTRLELVDGKVVIQNDDNSINTLPVPFGNVYSFVDGTCWNSTGTPYFYGSYLDQSFVDFQKNSAVSFTLSEAAVASVCGAGDSLFPSCTVGPHGDPENPVCARLVLTGTLEVLSSTTENEEYEFAKQALFERHGSMKEWPEDHDWIVAKIDLEDIWLIDFFGGASILDVDKYKAVKLSTATEDEYH